MNPPLYPGDLFEHHGENTNSAMWIYDGPFSNNVVYSLTRGDRAIVVAVMPWKAYKATFTALVFSSKRGMGWIEATEGRMLDVTMLVKNGVSCT